MKDRAQHVRVSGLLPQKALLQTFFCEWQVGSLKRKTFATLFFEEVRSLVSKYLGPEPNDTCFWHSVTVEEMLDTSMSITQILLEKKSGYKILCISPG